MRTLFFSDVHLGTSSARHEVLLKVLEELEGIPNIVIVGDFIDLQCLDIGLLLGPHLAVLRQLWKMSKKGTQIVFVPGNHDYYFRNEHRTEIGNIEIRNKLIWITADGSWYLVTHGDQYDTIACTFPILYTVGNVCYEWLVWLSRVLGKLTRYFGRSEFSLAHYLKLRLKAVMSFIEGFERLLTDEARQKKVDGVIAGHIHFAQDRMIGQIRYLNCGCWTEAGQETFLLEHDTGRISLENASRWLKNRK